MDQGNGPTGRSSFWTSLPGVLTGSAALVTALVGGLALFLDDDAPDPAPAGPGTVAEQPANASPAPAGAGASAGGAAEPACFASYLADVPGDRRKSVSAGVADFLLVRGSEPKTGTYAVRLLDDERTIGMIRLRVRTADETFHIDEVVDEACRSVADVANASRGGEPRVLMNWDELRIRTGGNAYLMRVGYSGGEVTVNLRRIAE